MRDACCSIHCYIHGTSACKQHLAAHVCRQGRKPLFIVCGSIMATMQIATGILTAVTFTGTKIPVTAGDIMIAFICIFVAMFAASWGPLGWLVCHPCFNTCPNPTGAFDIRLAWSWVLKLNVLKGHCI